MTEHTRRHFLKMVGGTVAVTAFGFPYLSFGAAKRVVIVGGGIGGSTAAKYIRLMNSSVDVTLIEPKKTYHTCFMSNEVLGGNRKLSSIEFDYGGLKARGVNVVHDMVSDIDPVAKKVMTKNGKTFLYDRCIVSPGIDFKWDEIAGYGADVAEKLPHAWQAGEQTAMLRDQIRAMKDGGTVIIVAPPNPFRCPPGPYERASQMAHYLKNNKPKSKIVILDAKAKFSKMGLFTEGWRRHYGYDTPKSMIEWVSAQAGGKVSKIDAKTMTVEAGVDFKGDVINVIPAQKANAIAFKADLVNDSGWCPVDQKTFESTKHKGIHVIGDASIASPMPKSGYSANSQAKVCAAAVVAALKGESAPAPSWINTCYSIITPEHGVSVAMVYRLGKDGKIIKVKGAGGLTPSDASDEHLKREVLYAHSWFQNVTNDVFG